MDALATVTKPKPLTEAERMSLNHCESIIEEGFRKFVEVGASLARIRERRLYRLTHETFEAYCEERWGWSSARARQLIGSADVVAEIWSVTTVTPANEAQARELIPVPEGERAEAWEEAQAEAEAEGKPVTARHVRAARERRALPKPRKPKPEKPVPEPEALANAEPMVVDAETEDDGFDLHAWQLANNIRAVGEGIADVGADSLAEHFGADDLPLIDAMYRAFGKLALKVRARVEEAVRAA